MLPEKIAEVRGWLQKALNDLRGAEVDLAASPPLVEDAMFHCQQAAEKAMKAFLTANDTPFRKTHDLDELAQACEKMSPVLAPSLAAARDLTVFAWEFRYPGESAIPSREEAEQALRVARQTCEAILGQLPKEADPLHRSHDASEELKGLDRLHEDQKAKGWIPLDTPKDVDQLME